MNYNQPGVQSSIIVIQQRIPFVVIVIWEDGESGPYKYAFICLCSSVI